MEFEFEWQGKIYKGRAIWEEHNGIKGYTVTIGKGKRRFIYGGSGSWSCVPFLESYELKNRIIAAIKEKEKGF